MNRFVTVLVVALAAITLAEAGKGKFGAGIDGIKNKLKGKFAHSSTASAYANSNSYGTYKTALPAYGSHGQNHYSYTDGGYGGSVAAKPYGSSSYDKYSSGGGHGTGSYSSHGGHGNVNAAVADAHVSGSGVASADAAAYGNGASAATATAVNGGAHGGHHHGGHGGDHYDHYDDDYSSYGHGGHSVSHGAAVVPPPRPVAPMRPTANYDSYKNLAYTRPSSGRFGRPHGGSASAASAVSGIGGAAASASSATAGIGGGHSGYYHPSGGHVSHAAAGTYSNSDHGRESSGYQRATEHLQEQEQGHKDDNHYYKSDSYGKAEDENLYEANNYNDEDIEQTPTVFRSKKSSGNYVKDYNKNRRETGSGVLAKDKHSSGFSRNVNRFNEDVDQRHSREGNGIIENSNRVSTHSFDDGDEEIYDSDGFGHPAHLHGPRSHGGSAAASAAVSGAGVASSASVSG